MNASPVLLIVDTSTRSTVLGLTLSDQTIDCTTPAVNSHSREILPRLRAMMDQAGIGLPDIDAIVFGQGPGSFTGLRIAAGVVQGLSYGLAKPVVQVSTMAALAQSHEGGGTGICVALSARLEEVYFGAYGFSEGLAVPLVDERVADVTRLPRLDPSGRRWVLTGDMPAGLQHKVSVATGLDITAVFERSIPAVEDLAALGHAGLIAGRAVDALQVAPVYLREEVASKPGQAT